jgi:hypothetical protein
MSPGSRPESGTGLRAERSRCRRRYPLPCPTDDRAVQFQVGWQDEHDELIVALAHQGLGAAGQRYSSNIGRLLACVDRLVPKHLERNAMPSKQFLHTIEHGLTHGQCSWGSIADQQ